MSLDPTERLEALRREVLKEQPPAAAPAVPVDVPRAIQAPLPETAAPRAPAVPSPPTSAAARDLPPVPARPIVAPGSASTTIATSPSPSAAPSGDEPHASGWDVSEAMGGAGLGMWVGLGLVAVGAYLLAARFLPGVALLGSLGLMALGIGLLAYHFQGRGGAWALYAGAVLTGIGAARVVVGILPIPAEGPTAIGIGAAFLAIAYLRNSQAGGYGWQGVVGVAALGLGLAQLAVGLLPGSPGLLDLVVPIGLISLGGYVVIKRLSRPPLT